MDIEKLKQLIKLAKEEKVVRLEFEDQNFKYGVTLDPEHSGGGGMISAQGVQASPAFPAPPGEHDVFEVRSPFVGTFYGSPSPESPPFVKIDDKVEQGQTLCILEAMKIMNEIDADVSGEIIDICVENESLVEYNQILFKIRK